MEDEDEEEEAEAEEERREKAVGAAADAILPSLDLLCCLEENQKTVTEPTTIDAERGVGRGGVSLWRLVFMRLDRRRVERCGRGDRRRE